MPDRNRSRGDNIDGTGRISGKEREGAGGLVEEAERATEDNPDQLDGRSQNAVGGITQTGREAKHGQQRSRMT